MAKFHCTVATPTSGLFSGDIDYASVPGCDGDFGVMSGHEMFLGQNRPGVLTLWLDPEGKERKQFAICRGFTQVHEYGVSVLGRFGRAIEDIDAEYVRGRLEETEAEIAELEKAEGEKSQAILDTHKAKREWYQFELSLVEGK